MENVLDGYMKKIFIMYLIMAMLLISACVDAGLSAQLPTSSPTPQEFTMGTQTATLTPDGTMTITETPQPPETPKPTEPINSFDGMFDKFTGLNTDQLAEVIKQAVPINSPIDEPEKWKADKAQIDKEFQEYLAQHGVDSSFTGDGSFGNGFYSLDTANVKPVQILTFKWTNKDGVSMDVPIFTFPIVNAKGETELLYAMFDVNSSPGDIRGRLYYLWKGYSSIRLVASQEGIDGLNNSGSGFDYSLSEQIVASQPGFGIDGNNFDKDIYPITGVSE